MKKERLILIVCMIISTLGLISCVSATTAYLFNSNEVSYNNNSSGIQSDNVQGAIDELYEEATNYSTLRKMIYPVGSIYFSVTDDTVAKVQERFGGTWESFGAGRTLVGVGTGTDSNSTSKTFAINTTGGEYTHKLTTTEMPSHNHTLQFNNGVGTYNAVWFGGYGSGTARGGINYNETSTGVRIIISSAGGNGAHNNLQPYITVYMYKRTA